MKIIKVIALLLISQLTYAQQVDSTISFETEQVSEFKKQTILEEYQIPYSTHKDVKRMLRTGVNEGLIPNGLYNFDNRSFPFEISYLNKVGNRTALLVGLTGSHGGFAGTSINLRLGYRKFLKSDENTNFNFTGRYIGIEAALDLNEIPHSVKLNDGVGIFEKFSNLPYYDTGIQLSAIYGLQLGGAFDFAIKAGVKYIGNGKVGEDFITNYNNPTVIPFISTNSLLSLSIGGGKKTLKDDCDFLNCNRQADQLLKLDLSRLIYLDPYMGNASIGVAYERRIGNSNFTSNTYGGIGVGYTKRFEDKLNYKPETPPENPYSGLGGLLQAYYNPNSKYDFAINGNIGTELRFYPIKNQEIRNGKSAQNLNGPYLKAFAELSYLSTSKYQRLLADNNRVFLKPQPFVIEYGIGLGYQKKVGSKYFYDVFVDYRKTNAQYSQFRNTTNLQFGSRFGIAK